MNNLVNMYGIELKKIFGRRILWISILIETLLVLLMLSSDRIVKFKYPDGKVMSGKEYYALARQKGEALSGKPMDDNFFEEIRRSVISYAIKAGYVKEEELNAVKAGTASEMMTHSTETALWDAAEETGCADAFGLISSLTDNIGHFLKISSKEWHERLSKGIASTYSSADVSDVERAHWIQSSSKIKKPLTYYYTKGYSCFYSQMYAFIWMLIILVAISLAGLFADERSTRMDALILSAKNGRKTIAYGKLLAGITIGVAEAVFLFLLNVVSSVAIGGTQGKDGVMQLFIQGSAWNLTLGQALLIFFVVTIFIGIFLSTFMMLLSQIFSSMQVIAITMAFFLVSFFPMPSQFGILAKLWNLRPNIILRADAFLGCNLFGGRLNSFEMGSVLYLITAVVFVVVTGVLYRRSQVKSR